MLDLEDYCFASEAAEIIGRNSGRAIRPAYIQQLVRIGVLSPVRVGGGRNLYPRTACEAVVVGRRGRKCVDVVA